jgi:16S rRNA C967 or C1407 C5-methylase (RsmB/RsmF family)/NOL1/NOP2/fmu family ribosome biogenesis protein
MLPAALLDSLTNVPGFDREAFVAVHESGKQLTTVRMNPAKAATCAPEWQVQGGVPWCPHGWYLQTRPSFTLDPLFHGGAYYVQEASSMFLWEIFHQYAGANTAQRVLDLCAAPGGKSTLIASYFRDGLVVANEVIKQRVQVLIENITKWGSDHVVVTNSDPAHFQSLPAYFDVMVVDAPCSGSGLFRKDPAAVAEWSEANVQLCSQRQQRILADALPALRADGLLVYATCSYSVDEDEAIAKWLVEEMNMEPLRLQLDPAWGIVESEVAGGAYGYRFFPDKTGGEGFFTAAFRKKGDEGYGKARNQALSFPSRQQQQQLETFFRLPDGFGLFSTADAIRTIRSEWLNDLSRLAGSLYIRKAGVELGSLKGKDFVPSHELALSLLAKDQFAKLPLTKDEALQYLRRKEINAEAPVGWTLVQYCALSLGWVKVLPNRINNYYPAEWRILKE